jgi:hypothetical protein
MIATVLIPCVLVPPAASAREMPVPPDAKAAFWGIKVFDKFADYVLDRRKNAQRDKRGEQDEQDSLADRG